MVSTPYILITTLYFGTYTIANLVDTASSTFASEPADTVTAGPAKFLATTGVNLGLCIYKDARFAGLFGAGAGSSPIAAGSTATVHGTKLSPVSTATTIANTLSAHPLSASAIKRRVPRTSLLLFALRDSLTVFASFNIPPILGPILGSQNVAQFLAPASVQIASTPVHLLGLDLYNRRSGDTGTKGERIGWQDRWGRIRRDWAGATLARIGRVVPAYGAGGVVNGAVRSWLLQGL